MPTSEAQNWKSTSFNVERKQGKAPGTAIFCFCGPFTARDMYGTLTPLALRNMLDLQSAPGDEPVALNILDLTAVPYMDSSGLGTIVTHFAHCRNRGIKMIAAGAGPRVLELFKLTKVDHIIPLAGTVEEVDVC